MQNEEYTRAMKYALNLLGKREYSSKLIQDKLKNRKFSDKVIAATINELTERRYLCDTRFTEVFIRDAIYKKRGLNRIKQELKQKGIDNDTMLEVIDELEVDWLEVAVSCLKAKFSNALMNVAQEAVNEGNRTEHREQFYKLKQKMLAKLQYQGFDFSTIQQAVEQILSQQEQEQEQGAET